MELILLLSVLGISAAVGAFGDEDDSGSDDPAPDPDPADTSDDFIPGTANSDKLTGSESQTVHGFAGNDAVTGDGETTLYGDTGNDTLTASEDATAFGGFGDDTVYASDRSQVAGDFGNDVLSTSGSVSVTGGSGNDLLHWTADGADNQAVLFGGDGDDRLFADRATTGAVTVAGGLGDDQLYVEYGANAEGGFGNDTLVGTHGSTLTGGAGADVFVARPDGAHYSLTTAPGMLVIDDFVKGQDRLLVDLTTAADDFSLVTDTEATTLTIHWTKTPTGAADDFTSIRINGVTGLTLSDFEFIEGTSLSAGSNKTPDFDLTIGQSADLSEGTANSDFLFSQDGDETILAGGGNDTVIGGDGGTDEVDLGTGNDRYTSGTSIADVAGGEGNDIFLVDTFADPDQTFQVNTYSGGGGNDLAALYDTTDNPDFQPPSVAARYVLDMGAGADTVSVSHSVDQMVSVDGGAGNDDISIWMGQDAVGGAGDDDFTISIRAEHLDQQRGAAFIQDLEPGDTLKVLIDADVTAGFRTEFVPYNSDTGRGGYTAFYLGEDPVFAVRNALSTDEADAVLLDDPRITIER